MAEFDTQAALFSALSAIDLRVYDSAPQQANGASLAVFPYVEVGAIVMAPLDTKERNGFDFAARIHTRSRSASMREAKEIQGQIYARLHHGDLTITGNVLYTDTHWDDLTVSATSAKQGALDKPVMDYTNIGLLFPYNDSTHLIVENLQMPHRYAPGTDL
jgi:hypothetical protein